jgi:hypothetical protein
MTDKVPVTLDIGHVEYLLYLVDKELYGHSDSDFDGSKASTHVGILRNLENTLTLILKAHEASSLKATREG